MKKILLAQLTLALFLVAACGKNPVTGTENAVKAPELMKTFASACSTQPIPNFKDGTLASSRVVLKFDHDTLTQVHQFFAHNDCTGPAAEVAYVGQFQNLTHNDASPNAKSIDINYNQAFVTAQNDASKHILQTLLKPCGDFTFNVNQRVEVTNQTHGSACVLKHLPEWAYNVVEVQGNNLSLGKDVSIANDDVTDANKRPTELEHSVSYTASDLQVNY